MTENRYIYASVGVSFEILDSWFGYTGDDEPTEREIEEYDYLVIGLAPDQDAAKGICRRLNDQQDEINHLSNFGLHIILDKKNKEIEQLKEQLEICKDARQAYKQDWKACSSYCDTYKDEIHTLKDNIQRLIEENEQLKSKINFLECGMYEKKEDDVE